MIVCPLSVMHGRGNVVDSHRKAAVTELPATSVAVAFTVVVPTGKLEPDALLVITVEAEQLSLAVTVKLTGAAQVPGIAFTAILAGQVMTGGVLSMTVIVCVAVVLRLAASVALKMRVMISGLAIEPAPPLFDSETVTGRSSAIVRSSRLRGKAGGT